MTDAYNYICHRANGPIDVDGDLDKAAWSNAPKTPLFGDMTSSAPGFFATRAALLWDDEALYAAFWLTERDVYCTHSERTGLTWAENVVEFYIAGSGAYYTLAIAADNRRSEMFFIWKDAYMRGGRYDVAEFDLAEQKPMVFGGDAGPHHGHVRLEPQCAGRYYHGWSRHKVSGLAGPDICIHCR